jgi:hypothetical protein
MRYGQGKDCRSYVPTFDIPLFPPVFSRPEPTRYTHCMVLLEPRWEQPKPTPEEAQDMCNQVSLTVSKNPTDAIEKVLGFLRKSHRDGGALFAEFLVGESGVFDWFASRNRLAEFSILTALLRRDEVLKELPDLLSSTQPGGELGDCSIASTDGFTMESPFLLDGRIAQALYAGGAYGQTELDARGAKQLAIAFCEELFEQRYSEIVLFSNFSAWTPWFHGIAWDWTAFIFDRRKRNFAILAITDSD